MLKWRKKFKYIFQLKYVLIKIQTLDGITNNVLTELDVLETFHLE